MATTQDIINTYNHQIEKQKAAFEKESSSITYTGRLGQPLVNEWTQQNSNELISLINHGFYCQCYQNTFYHFGDGTALDIYLSTNRSTSILKKISH